MEVSVLSLEAGKELSYLLREGRQAYLIQIEGSGEINGHPLSPKDAAEITGESITLRARETSHYILFDMSAK